MHCHFVHVVPEVLAQLPALDAHHRQTGVAQQLQHRQAPGAAADHDHVIGLDLRAAAATLLRRQLFFCQRKEPPSIFVFPPGKKLPIRNAPITILLKATKAQSTKTTEVKVYPEMVCL